MRVSSDTPNVETPSAAEDLPVDDFEIALLPLVRHFTLALSGNSPKGWQVAYRIAAERWGAPIGLSVAHEIGKLVASLEMTRGSLPCVNDPLGLDARHFVTSDEANFLLLIHYMRRDETAKAREALWTLTEGHTHAAFIRDTLSFAAKHSLGARPKSGQAPILRAV